jgi:tetratricopeptide (TPR) repeat protein
MQDTLLRPKDVPASTWFGRCNFQREEDLDRLTTILLSTVGPSVVLLPGEAGIGRRYLLQAAVHRLSQAGRPAPEILEIDLEGYDEEVSLPRFLELQMENRQMARGQRRRDLTETFLAAAHLGMKGTGWAALFSLILGLKEPVAALKRLLGDGEKEFSGEFFSARETFATFLGNLSGQVILHVTDPTFFHAVPSPENPRRWLPEVVERYPHVILVVSCSPGDQAADLVPGARHEPERFELDRLTVDEVSALLNLRFAPNAFPADFARTLFRYSNGLPGLLGGAVWKLHLLGALDEDEAWTWKVDDAKVAEVLSEGLLEPLSLAFHEYPEYNRALWTFLLDAALCGVTVPASLLLSLQGLGEEIKEELADLIDEELVDKLGVFEDLQYRHPSFPVSINVYRFREPLIRLAILEHFAEAERQERASQIAQELRRELPVRTRDVARLFVALADHLGEEERDGYLRDLDWWVGTDGADALRDELTLAVATGRLKHEILWSALLGTEERWPAYRRLALLDAYGAGPRDDEGNSLGVPLERFGEFQTLRAELLVDLGQYRDALGHAEQGASIAEAQNGKHSLQYLRDLVLIGIILRRLGDFARAKEQLQTGLELSERLLGPHHPNTGSTKNQLAEVLADLGELALAQKLYEEVLETRIRHLGSEHHYTLTTKASLAVVLGELGDLGQARELNEEVLEAMNRLLGPEHPHTLGAKNNLAGVLKTQGDLGRARELNEEVLEAMSRLLGPEHPRTLGAKNNLAVILEAQGDLGRARELCEEVLEANSLAPEHPHMLSARNNLAAVLEAQGDLGRARELYEEVLEARTRLLGAQHPDTLSTNDALTGVVRDLGDVADSRDRSRPRHS